MGKVRDTISTMKGNIKNIQTKLSSGDFAGAKMEWRVLKVTYEVFEQQVKGMSGKSKIWKSDKQKEINKFKSTYANFKTDIGDTLDSMAV